MISTQDAHSAKTVSGKASEAVHAGCRGNERNATWRGFGPCPAGGLQKAAMLRCKSSPGH